MSFVLISLTLPCITARCNGVAFSHCGFWTLTSISALLTNMVTSSVFPLLAAAWRGVFPVSAAILTLIGGLTWKQNGDN